MPNTTSDQVIVERPSESVAMVRLNRPQVRNALNLSLRRELASVFHLLSDDAAVRCVVITGDDKAFCAGADLREYVDASPTEILARNMHLLWGAIAIAPSLSLRLCAICSGRRVRVGNARRHHSLPASQRNLVSPRCVSA